MRPRFASWLVIGGAALIALAPTCGSDGGFRPQPIGNAHPPVFDPLPTRPAVQQVQLQMAYNFADGKVYGRARWASNRGHLDQFYQYANGAWSLRGAPLREIGRPGELASAEAQLTLMWGDPNAAASSPNFAQIGCALACHDDGSYMPDWTEDGRNDPVAMYLPQDPFYDGKRLDVWAWRAHTTAPIGYWSDQTLDQSGLNPDDGNGGAFLNGLVDGHPAFVLDPSSSASGDYAIPVAQLPQSPDYFFQDPFSPTNVGGIAAPSALGWDAAVASGYVPFEGDTVPYWVLGRPDGGLGDVLGVLSADGGASNAGASGYDHVPGQWTAYFTRSLTGGSGDLRFVRGRQYALTMAVHRDQTGGRDHYISLPVIAWLEDPRNPGGFLGADFAVRQLTVPGELPDFDDTATYPPFTVDLVLPGVLSLEYLTDTRDAAYVFGQAHGGAFELQPALDGPVGIGCRACHTIRVEDPLTPFLQGGALELRTPRRGGLFEATPISFAANVRPVLENRCLPCHAAGGTAAAVAFTGPQAYATVIGGGRIRWRDPLQSPLLRLPAENGDGQHPPQPPLADFAGSDDYLRLLYWIRFNAPDN